MIEDPRGAIAYEEMGAGPDTLVLVPGSCSTGAAWRPVMAALGPGHRFITTSLLGYGTTAERRTAGDLSIDREAEAIEAVIARAGGPVHLVGHSFGGLVSVAVALRGRAPLTRLTVLEAPAMELLRGGADDRFYRDFRAMTDRYFAAFERGQADAIAHMIDFYGGAGTFASWPDRVRAYAIETTAVNLRDWETAFAFALTEAALASVTVPATVCWGGHSHPAARRANQQLAAALKAETFEIEGATHFMIATHAAAVAEVVKRS